MSAVRVGERPLKSVWLRWDAAEEQQEREVAAEMVAALATVVDGWLEPFSIEARVGCYDRERFTEAAGRPAQPFHILVREPLPDEVSIRPTYRAIEQRAPRLSQKVIDRWLAPVLAQPCGEPARFEPSLRELLLHELRVPAPVPLASAGVLALDCYAGTITIPLERDDGRVWISIPPARLGLPPPLTFTVENLDGGCQLSIDLYWSPWLDELTRPDSPLTRAIARLEARGWRPSDG